MDRPPYGRLLVALLAGAFGVRGAVWVDQGVTHAWSPLARSAWAIALVLAALVGVWGMVTFVCSLLDDSGEVSRGITAYVVTLGLAVVGLFTAGVGLQAIAGVAQERTWLVGMGLILALLTWTRPEWFWEHPKAQFLREFIGDRLTMLAYAAIALALVYVGIATPNPTF
jgi:hypothetical protein